MRSTFAIKRGKTMFSAGLGRHGPYALVSQKLDRRTNVKASIGTRGKIVGFKHVVSRKGSFGMEHNLTTGKTTLKGRYKKINIST